MTTARLAARMCRLVPAAALVAAALSAPASTTLGCPAIASAAPVWDIEDYDNCVKNIDSNEDPELILEMLKICCEGSGGIWRDNLSKCVSPTGEGGAGAPPPKPGDPSVPDVQPPTVNPAPPMIPTVPVQPPNVG